MYLEQEEVQLEAHVKKKFVEKTSPLQKLSFTGQNVEISAKCCGRKKGIVGLSR